MRVRALSFVLVMAAVAACSSAPHKAPPRPRRSVAPDLAAIYAAGRSQPVADPVYPERGHPAVDVLHYDLALNWSPRKKELAGTATLAIRAAADTDELMLDFSG